MPASLVSHVWDKVVEIGFQFGGFGAIAGAVLGAIGGWPQCAIDPTSRVFKYTCRNFFRTVPSGTSQIEEMLLWVVVFSLFGTAVVAAIVKIWPHAKTTFGVPDE